MIELCESSLFSYYSKAKIIDYGIFEDFFATKSRMASVMFTVPILHLYLVANHKTLSRTLVKDVFEESLSLNFAVI